MSTLLASAANLATDVAAWMSRSDLTGDIPTMIVLAEAKLNRLLRNLEHETINPAFPINAEYVPVPFDFLEFKSGYLNTSPKRPLYYIPSDTQTELFGSGSNFPKYFTMVGTNFRFGPAPDGTYSATMVYYSKLPTLSGVGVQTNWLLAQHPDVYLYGVILEASGKVQDDSLTQKYQAAVAEVVQQIKNADQRKRYGGNGMAVRVA